MIADRIAQWLETHDGGIGADSSGELAVLARDRAGRAFERQFCLPREDRAKVVHASGPWNCLRKFRLVWEGVKGTIPEARTKMGFFMGDTAETTVLLLARLAGIPLTMWDPDTTVHVDLEKMDDGEGARMVEGHPDAVLVLPREPGALWFPGLDSLCLGWEGVSVVEGDVFNVEVKSMTPWAFSDFVESGGDDTWGYMTQQNLYCLSTELRALGRVRGTIRIGVDRSTGAIAERFYPVEDSYVHRAAGFVATALNAPLESIPRIAPVDELNRGKRTGRTVLGLACTYCEFAGAVFRDGKPVCWAGQVEIERASGKIGAKTIFVFTGEPPEEPEMPF